MTDILTPETAIAYMNERIADFDLVSVREYVIDGIAAIDVSFNYWASANVQSVDTATVWIENGKLYGEW
jgi:hypothetical protein